MKRLICFAAAVVAVGFGYMAYKNNWVVKPDMEETKAEPVATVA